MSTSIEVKINPAVLKWARESAHYNVQEASQKSKINSDQIVSFETGKSKPNYTQLLKLAELYQRPAMIFFSPEIPESESDELPDFRSYNHNGEFSPEVIFELRSARFRRQSLIDIEFDDYQIPIFNLNAKISDNKEDIASNIRKNLGISKARQDTLINPDKALEFYISLLESLGILVFQFYGIESEEMRGYAINYSRLPIIGINVKEHAHGRIFTLFHELAHLALKKEGISNINRYKLEDKIEIFCNQIAAEILLPKRILEKDRIVQKINGNNFKDQDIKALSKKYKVSPEVIVRRLISIGKLSDDSISKKNKWNNYIGSNYKSKTVKENIEPVKKAKKTKLDIKKTNPNVSKALKRNGLFFTEKVFEAYDEKLITSSDLSEYLGEKLHVINEIHNKIINRGIES